MKNSLGRVFLIFLVFLHVEFFASSYEWSVKSNKKTAFVNEPIYLTYVCTFSDRAGLYAIEFNPDAESDDFTLNILSESKKIVDGKRVNSYEFVVFAKRAKVIDFKFEAIMKMTTRESIENTVIGRDNVEKEDFTLKKIRLEPLKVDVKPSGRELVGNFIIEVKKDRPQVKAYEPYHLEIAISGRGNFDAVKPIEFNIEGVNVFAEKAMQNIELTKDGYSGRLSQKFAFVGSGNFRIPELKIEYFDLEKKRPESLTLSEIDVQVEKAYVKEELLDKPESNFKIDYNYFYYALIFISGFLFGRIRLKKTKIAKNGDELFKQKTDEAKSLKELMIILALKDAKKYEQLISEIESKKLTSLGDAKKLL